MPRLFIAVWPPPEIVAVLRDLPRVEADGVRFTTEDRWHATLRFLGDVDLDTARAAIGRVRFARTTATVGPAVTRLGAGVVIAPVAGLDAVAATVRGATAAIGEPVDPRPFRGHLTLARQRRGDRCSLDGAPIRGTFPVDEIALVRSDLRSDGARYTTVATVGASSGG